MIQTPVAESSRLWFVWEHNSHKNTIAIMYNIKLLEVTQINITALRETA